MLTETNIRNAYAYCCQDISLIENYEEAVNDNKKYVCHHKNGLYKSIEELKQQGLYYNRPASELIFLSINDHNILHNKGKHHTEETRKKMSEAQKGEKNHMYGKHHTEEARKKISDNHADIKGEKHPNAKRCTINGITYGCLKDAHKALYPNIQYNTFTRKYKNKEL